MLRIQPHSNTSLHAKMLHRHQRVLQRVGKQESYAPAQPLVLRKVEAQHCSKCTLTTPQHTAPQSRSVHVRIAPVEQVPTTSLGPTTPSPWPGVVEGYWQWRGHTIRYQRSANSQGPPVVLVHGFGGNADHWRKSTGVLATDYGLTAYSIDLLGYGYSSKPDPRSSVTNSIYCFETWGQQLADFIEEVVGAPSFLICNSVGGLTGLQTSIIRPDLVQGVQLLDISLRMLHVKRQPPWQRPFVAAFQRLLRETDLGQAFFASVATERTVKNILRQAYGNKDAVTDELVQCILKPGLQPGAVSVFLDFISYSGGPLPEDLISATTRPVSIVWGERDPWEPVELGRKYFAHLKGVKEFIALPGVGHCPMDEAPDLVNPLIHKFCTTTKAWTSEHTN